MTDKDENRGHDSLGYENLGHDSLGYENLGDTRARQDHLLRAVRELRGDVRAVRDEMREQIEKLRLAEASREGSSRAWRAIGGVAMTIALAGAGGALALGMDASADHLAVARHEAVIETMRADVTHIREDVAAMRTSMEHERTRGGTP